MTTSRKLLVPALAAALAVPSAAEAAKNPYTAKRVCGSGYKVIDRHKLTDTNPYNGNTVHLSTVVLMYNASTGKNCAVNLKRYRVGKEDKKTFGDFMSVSLATRPLNNANVDGDSDEFRFYAGPVYVRARGKCVQWSGSATMLMQKYFTPRGTYNDAFKSRWSHCR